MSTQDIVISMPGIARTGRKERLKDEMEDGLDLTPSRSILQRAAYPPRLSLNGLLIGLLCSVAIMVSGFLVLPLPSPLNFLHAAHPHLIGYTLQIPLALLVATLLGPFMGVTSVLLFLFVGLALFPVFAGGGGWHYVTQPGFGYLAGSMLLGHVLGKTFHKAFQKQEKESRSLKILRAAVVSALMVHAFGLLYLLVLTLCGQLPLAELPGWALCLSIETIPYDVLATIVGLCLVRPIRLCLWLVLY